MPTRFPSPRRTVLAAPAVLAALAAVPPSPARGEPVPCYTVNHTRTPYPFNRMFDLWLSPGMVDSLNGGWTQADIDSFCLDLVDADPHNREDVFPRIWSYYGAGDSAAAYDSLYFVVGGKPFTRIRTDLYFQSDCCRNTCGEAGCPGGWSAECREGGWIECGGYGVYTGGNRFAVAGALCSVGRVFTPREVSRSTAWSHELAHLCDKASKPYIDPAFSELVACGAEYVAGGRWTRRPEIPRSTEYDVSLMAGNRNNHRCGGNETRCKYNQYRLFNAYLFEHFSGEADSLDLVYRWLRYREDGKALSSFRGLGRVLTEEPFADRVPGETAAEKMGNLYQRFAIARYVDAPEAFEGRYGFGPEVSPRPMHFFEWPDTVAMPRAMAVPPRITVGEGPPTTLEAWRDPVQAGAEPEPLRIVTTGTDYLVFTAGDAAEPGGGGRVLRIRIRGTGPPPPNQSFRLGYAAYPDAAPPLYERTPSAVVENAGLPHDHPGGILDAELVIEDFGGSVRGVVVVFSMVEAELSPGFWGVRDMDYTITYGLE